MSLPIIFLNYGNPWYLKYALSQCKGTNPDARVILLGDKSNYGYAGIEHHSYADYTEYGAQLSTVYEHMSTNPYKFELFCIERWFTISSFLEKNNIKECFVMDSDVLLYDSIEKYKSCFGSAKMTLYDVGEHSLSSTAGSTFIFNSDILRQFCNFCLSVYTQKNSAEYTILRQHYEKRQAADLTGGVCDMNLWHLFYINHKDEIFDTYNLVKENVFLDINITSAKSPKYIFESSANGWKKVTWRNGKPYGKIVEPVEKEVFYACLHFQGFAKEKMPEYTTYKGYYYWYNMHYITLKNKIRRLLPV